MAATKVQFIYDHIYFVTLQLLPHTFLPTEVTLELPGRQYFLSSQLSWARNWYSLNVAVIVVWDWQSNDINQSISSSQLNTFTLRHVYPARAGAGAKLGVFVLTLCIGIT